MGILILILFLIVWFNASEIDDWFYQEDEKKEDLEDPKDWTRHLT